MCYIVIMPIVAYMKGFIMDIYEVTIRKHVQLGYKTMTGRTFWRQIWVDEYNRIQDRINKYIEAGRAVPESLLNESHRYFSTVAYGA